MLFYEINEGKTNKQKLYKNTKDFMGQVEKEVSGLILKVNMKNLNIKQQTCI